MQVNQQTVADEVAESPVKIQVDTARALIELTWSGYVPGPIYRQVLNHAREQVNAHGVKFWLADLRGMGAILRPDELWTTLEWFPSMSNTPLRRMAIVQGADFFNRMSVERIMDASTPILPFEVAWFEDRDGALAWLLSEVPALQAT
ncbi:MAG: STAS/SEC14 domain-containing protein [Flavobacteriales bacterium]|nr:STAS/SEC14 domain-containing protein [Flavobacteriales bacterium]